MDETIRFYQDYIRFDTRYLFNSTKTSVDGSCTEPLQQTGIFWHDLYANYLEMMPVKCSNATCLNCSDRKRVSGIPVFDADCESFNITFSGASTPRQYFLIDSEPTI